MLNHLASLTMSTSVLEALPGKLDIKRHLPNMLYIPNLHKWFHARIQKVLSEGVQILVDDGIEDPNTTINGPSSARQ